MEARPDPNFPAVNLDGKMDSSDAALFTTDCTDSGAETPVPALFLGRGCSQRTQWFSSSFLAPEPSAFLVRKEEEVMAFGGSGSVPCPKNMIIGYQRFTT